MNGIPQKANSQKVGSKPYGMDDQKKKKKALGNADFTQFDLVATLGLDEIVDIEDDVNFHFGDRGQLKNAGIPSLAEVSVPATGGAENKGAKVP